MKGEIILFNKYQWTNYLKSGGDKVIKIFEEVCNKSNIYVLGEFCKIIKELHSFYCPLKIIYEELNLEELLDFFNNFDLRDIKSLVSKNTEYDYKKNCYKIWNSIKKYYKVRNNIDVLDIFISNQVYITTQLAIEYPEIFVPYYFYGNFNILSYIVETFQINLDIKNLPSKKDYKERFMYYGKICKAFQDFRENNNLSIPELWAFMYDYGPKCVGGLQYIKNDLPEPRNAFLIGGSKNDVFLESLDNKNNISLWQCNPDTQTGDMIVMYLRTPYSKLDSVWRSVCEGFIDPFFWYYRCTYISKPKKLHHKNRFTLKEMRTNNILNQLPIVKKNMQGVNGVELSPSIYNYIVEKNEDIKKIKYKQISNTTKISTEHDVEVKLLEPLLEKLGWKKCDYITQFSVKIGRKEKIIPDYVILPTYTPYRETARFIWEVKKSINNTKQLEKDCGQVISYARRLKSPGCALISQEGVWIMQNTDDYENIIFKATWNELKKDDIFKKLFNIAGK